MSRPRHDYKTRIWTYALQEQLEELYCAVGLSPDEIGNLLNKTTNAIKARIGITGLTYTPQAVQARRERGIHRGPKKATSP